MSESTLLKSVKEHYLFHIIIICLAIVICYFGAWNAYFFTGDDYEITGWVKSQPTIFDAIRGYGNGVRFLNYAMIWSKTQIFDLNAGLYFVAGLIQQMIVSTIVYWLFNIVTGRRLAAFIGALLFAVQFSFWEVMTSISATDYTFWAMFYTSTITLFAAHLKYRKRIFYVGAVFTYLILSFAHDFTLNIPLALMAYHILLGRGDKSLRSIQLSELRAHIPFWILWGIHIFIQFRYLFGGTSEALYSANDYGLGLHILTNLSYLVYLIVPNIPIIPRLTEYFGGNFGTIYWLFINVLSWVFIGILLYLFWKGSSIRRFALIMIFIPFLQYTLWHGSYAGASRYLYMPSIGFSLLLAVLILGFFHQKRGRFGKFAIYGVIASILIFDLVIIQLWLQRHLENSLFRRTFVTAFQSDFQNRVNPETHILIEVPEAKFLDLGSSCDLIFAIVPDCESFVSSTLSDAEVQARIGNDRASYWLEVVDGGYIEKSTTGQ